MRLRFMHWISSSKGFHPKKTIFSGTKLSDSKLSSKRIPSHPTSSLLKCFSHLCPGRSLFITRSPWCTPMHERIRILWSKRARSRQLFPRNTPSGLAKRVTSQSASPSSGAKVDATNSTALIAFCVSTKVDVCSQETKNLTSFTRQLVSFVWCLCVRCSQNEQRLTCKPLDVMSVGTYVRMGFVQMWIVMSRVMLIFAWLK